MNQKVIVYLGGGAKFITERTSALGDVKLTVINAEGVKQSLDILEDHLPVIIKALVKLKKDLGY